ncbi:MAG: diguanylate cyclase [Lachnospiraceae bacterium]|nr:diguanylate cyclase [Lachnospiraceae bacterium]
MANKDSKPKTDKRKRSRKGTISGHMYGVAILPVVLFALVIIIAGIPFLTGILYDSAEKELKDACMSTKLLMDAKYYGDYRLTGSDSLYLYKGDTDITRDYSVVDSIKDSTGLDITLFYKDTRILTTLADENGVRMVGTGIASQIQTVVYENGEEAFYHNTMIFGKPYFTYYMPLVSSHGNIQGMIAAARPAEDVNRTIRTYILMLAGIAVVLTALMVFIVIRITKPMTVSIESIFKFVKDASSGNETAVLDEHVLARRDELGEIGESVLSMQRSMRNMMESDPLTGLFNRRSAQRKMGPIIAKAKNGSESFCICIGDIDFFKSVNDTYGHDAGDEVLIKVADTIREHMKNIGFVARWGGEEFLMVFDRTSLIMAENSLWSLLEKIRALKIRYDNYIIEVTMSFGVSEWDKKQSVDDLIKSADDKLYTAKNSGRNRVVSMIEGSEEDDGSGEMSEIDKLLKTISSGAKEEMSEHPEDAGHFENLSAKEFEDILNGKADEEAAGTGNDVMTEGISFSADSYTDDSILRGSSSK